jgi:hypothetical protein
MMNIMRCNLCYQCNVTDMGTTDGINPIQVSHKEGYFQYGYGNINVLIKKLSYGFMHGLHATTITCTLKSSIMADSQPSLMNIPSKSCKYSNRGGV